MFIDIDIVYINNKELRMSIKKHISAWPLSLDQVPVWATLDQIFSKEECEKIIKLAIKNKPKDGLVGKNSKLTLDKKIRQSKIIWLQPEEDTGWIFRRITDAIVNLNNNFFQFDINGMIEGLQFTIYKAPNSNYKKHTDRTYGNIVRKLSLSIELSPPESYEGGNLCLYESEKEFVLEKGQGRINMFPSFVLHEVTTVTKGTRYSLVAWVTGKQFK